MKGWTGTARTQFSFWGLCTFIEGASFHTAHTLKLLTLSGNLRHSIRSLLYCTSPPWPPHVPLWIGGMGTHLLWARVRIQRAHVWELPVTTWWKFRAAPHFCCESSSHLSWTLLPACKPHPASPVHSLTLCCSSSFRISTQGPPRTPQCPPLGFPLLPFPSLLTPEYLLSTYLVPGAMMGTGYWPGKERKPCIPEGDSLGADTSDLHRE